MIELLRTHPRHLAGTRSTFSISPGLPIHGPHEAPRFGQVLQEALGKVNNASPQDPQFSPEAIHQRRRISSAGPAKTDLAVKVNSALTPSRGHGDFRSFIEEASRSFGVEKGLIQAVIKAESNFNPKAKSRSGAVGLMQLLPSTGRELGVRDLYNPRENIIGGTRYLAMLLDRYEGNLESALAAYNWGPGNLEKSPDRLPRETEKYIQRILRYLETMTA